MAKSTWTNVVLTGCPSGAFRPGPGSEESG